MRWLTTSKPAICGPEGRAHPVPRRRARENARQSRANNGRRPTRRQETRGGAGGGAGERPNAPSTRASARPWIGDRPRAAGGLASLTIPRAADNAAPVAEPTCPPGEPARRERRGRRVQGARHRIIRSAASDVGCMGQNRPVARPRRPSSGRRKARAHPPSAPVVGGHITDMVRFVKIIDSLTRPGSTGG